MIDEVPAHRLPIKNCVVDTSYRPKAYEFILKQIKEGHQAYIICPLVEESENSEGENVTDYSKMLESQFPADVKIAMLHGKMKPEQKNQIMEAFSRNEIQILVSTTVIEVGVNVPNATVMMIENADRFGLAQLHQLRGRVGRGDAQSYCIMINGSRGKTAKKRLEILNRSNDGFYIASEDLKLRTGRLFWHPPKWGSGISACRYLPGCRGAGKSLCCCRGDPCKRSGSGMGRASCPAGKNATFYG